MAEATINDGVIECGEYRIADNTIFQRHFNYWKAIIWVEDFDDLYQVLHAWKLAQAYDKKYLAKVAQAMKDDPLYGGDHA